MKTDGRDNLIKKVVDFVLRPPWYVAIIIGILTITLVAVSVYTICIEFISVYLYFLYGIAAIFLSLTVWHIIIFAPKIKKSFILSMNKRKFTASLINDYGFRAVTFSSVAFVVNIGYAVFNGVIGIVARSSWFGALSLYYIVLSALKAFVLINAKRINKLDGDQSMRKYRLYKYCGVSLILLSLALSGAVVQMALTDKAFEYADLMIYIAAFYAFYKLTVAIIQFVKSRRHGRTINETLGLITLSDGLVSILALQTALLVAFGEGNNNIYNAITGTVIMLIIIAIGIYMTATAKNKIFNKVDKDD